MRKARLPFFALVLGIALLAVACGDDDDDGYGGGAKDTSPAAATTTASPAAASPTAQAATSTVRGSQHPALGRILVDGQGRTLYTFTQDQGSASNCYDACAQNWPPLTVASGTPTAGEGATGKLGTTARRDGAMQVTYEGAPLYRFARDAAAGDANGEGVGGVWFVIKLGASPSSGAAPALTPAPLSVGY